jgi:acyl carrier protein/alpha-ketoglutarate-dependent taurine dioxygenase
MGEMPLTGNGKIDRRALPAPESARADLENGSGNPRTPTEELIADTWKQVLGIENLGIHDNFFDLGGHSLLATQVMSRLRQTFQVEVPLRRLFEVPTVAGLARSIEEALREGKGLQVPSIVPVSRDGLLPLSFAQQRLWFFDQLMPDSSLYNNPTAVRFAGRLNLAALEQSFSEIVRRHEVLRTTFTTVSGEPVQVIAPASCSTLPVIDLSGLPEAERSAEAQRLAGEEARRPFDLSYGPLLRLSLIRLEEQDHAILVTMHHIITDGWSTGIFDHESGTFYKTFSAGDPSSFPELHIQYADFACWQREWLQGEVLDAELAYWKRQLGGNLPAMQLPADRSRPAVPTWRGETQSSVLPPASLSALRALSRQERVTLFMTLLAAFQTLLHRYSGQDDIIVGTDIANRNRTETEGLIGLFVNLLTLRTDLSNNPTFRELLGRVREVTLGAFAHQDMPFDKLVEELRPERSLNVTPLFQVLFILQNTPRQAAGLSELSLDSLGVGSAPSRFDLTLSIMETDQGLVVTWRYNVDLFDAATIARMIGNYETLLESIVAQPEARLDALEILTESEKRQQLMQETRREETNFKKFKSVKPRPISLPQGELVKTRLLGPDQPLPLVIEPAVTNVDLLRWAQSDPEFIENKLSRHGAILFHGFDVRSVPEFEDFALAVCPNLFNQYGDLPRENVGRNIYTSTPYPSEQAILFHNESSHMHKWPGKIWFYCVQAASQGGETPIVDCRKVYRLLDPQIRDRFERKKLMYVRNYIEGLDVSWQEFFQTSDRSAVEEHCRRASVEFEWRDGGRLTTRKVCEAVAEHPNTGERLFFNQVQLHHPSCLDRAVRASLLSLVGSEDDMPRNVYYGDGSRIEDSVIDEVREVYDRAAVSFRWQEGDILMLDNMLTAHGRNPFAGPRKIVVAMGDMIDQEDVLRVGESHVAISNLLLEVPTGHAARSHQE